MRLRTEKLTLAAMFLALGMVLPLLTGQIPAIGKMLLPMHLPVFLCAFLCGWQYALPVGIIVPLLRTALFGKPAPYPDALAIAAELATYALVAGLLYRGLSKKGLGGVYLSLAAAMVAGRMVRGVVQLALLSLRGLPFGAEAFFGGIVLMGLPGILLQWILIPTVVQLWRHRHKAANGEEHAMLPDEIEAALRQVDWTERDVLVGSIGSEAQLMENLKHRFYYVPAKYLPDPELPVRIIAIYQGNRYRETGVRYFARVQSMRVVQRGEIPVPLRRGNPEEDYVFFTVEDWQVLEAPLDAQGESVTAPRWTNSFLLHHADSVYQLFAVESEQDYRLLCALRRMAHRIREGYRRYTVAIDGMYFLRAQGRIICFCRGEEPLFRFRLEQLERDPKSMFVVLKNKM